MRVPTLALCLLAVLATAAGHEARHKSRKDGNLCQTCRSVVSFASFFNASEHRNEHKEILESFCELYYPVSTDFQQGPCPIFVEGLYYLLDHTDPVTHCDQIGFCNPMPMRELLGSGRKLRRLIPSRHSTTRVKALQYKGPNALCQFCEESIQQIKARTADANFTVDLKRRAYIFCAYLSIFDDDALCKRVLHNYIDRVLVLISHIDPATYCRAIQLCGDGESNRVPFQSQAAASAKPVLPSLVDFSNFGLETSANVGQRSPAAPNSVMKGSNCAICKMIVKDLTKIIHENRTEENIQSALDKVCSMIFSGNTQKLEQCTSMVNAYTKELIQLLIDETDPEMICIMLEQCMNESSNSQARDALSPVSVEIKPQTVAGFGLAELITALDPTVELNSMRACVECKLFIRYLRDKLESPQSQIALKGWLMKNLCETLPDKQLIESCTGIVEQYSDVFFKAVAGTIEPQAACADLGVCESHKPSVFLLDLASMPSRYLSPVAVNLHPRPKGAVCEQCVTTVTQIDEYLSSHSIDNDVSVLIDNVCNKMPDGSLKDQCVMLIKNFGAEIVRMIATMDNPRRLCAEIYLC